MNKYSPIANFIIFFVFCFSVFSQDMAVRKEKFLRFIDGLKRIPVNETLLKEKEAKLEELTKMIMETKEPSEWEKVYSVFEEVRKWLLTNAIEKPSLSEEELIEDEENWIIKNKFISLIINKQNLEFSLTTNNCNWKFYPSDTDDIILLDKRFSISSAGKKESEPLITGNSKGYIIKFSEFSDFPTLTLYLTVQLSKDCLMIDISSSDFNKSLYEVRFPKPVILEASEQEYSVLPLMQGIILFSNYPRAFVSKDLCNTRTLYMPWWAHIKDRNGVLSILATPDDAGAIYNHPPGGPTKVQPVWYSSMGELRYLQRIEYYFLSDVDYVSVAKRYKKWVKEHRNFVSLREKITRCPIVEKIIGVPVIYVGALYHMDRLSDYFVKDPIENNHQLQTFDEIGAKLKLLKEKGLDSAYVHLDGWGYLGYDSSHPDTVPVGYEAGGVEGLKRLSELCKELGYIFALHDNYIDCYLNAVSANVNIAVKERTGIITQYSVWCGGHQSILSPRFVLNYLIRNYEWLENTGVTIQGVYLDVFSVISLTESYHSFCPITRSECANYRKEPFLYLKSKGYIVSSEEPTDSYVPILDLVHHAPYYLDGLVETGEKVGIPVPLFNLVYHESIIMPWYLTESGGWGIPKEDAGYLHCLLNAGMPCLRIEAEQNEIEKAKEFCKLQAHCQFLEMTNHEFLDNSYRKQRSTFADGTTITVDFDSKQYEIKYPENKTAE